MLYNKHGKSDEYGTQIPAKVHYSVFERLKQGGDGYAPFNLPSDYAVVERTGTITPLMNQSSHEPEESTEPAHIENKQQAAARYERQKFVWDKV